MMELDREKLCAIIINDEWGRWSQITNLWLFMNKEWR